MYTSHIEKEKLQKKSRFSFPHGTSISFTTTLLPKWQENTFPLFLSFFLLWYREGNIKSKSEQRYAWRKIQPDSSELLPTTWLLLKYKTKEVWTLFLSYLVLIGIFSNIFAQEPLTRKWNSCCLVKRENYQLCLFWKSNLNHHH